MSGQPCTGSCEFCGADIGGGPGGWFALHAPGGEVCPGPSPTSFHEPIGGVIGAVLEAVRAWVPCTCQGLKQGAHFHDCLFNNFHDQGFAEIVAAAIDESGSGVAS